MRNEIIKLVQNNIKTGNLQNQFLGILSYLPPHLRLDYFRLLSDLFAIRKNADEGKLTELTKEAIEDLIEQLEERIDDFSEKLDQIEEVESDKIASLLISDFEMIESNYLKEVKTIIQKGP